MAALRGSIARVPMRGCALLLAWLAGSVASSCAVSRGDAQPPRALDEASRAGLQRIGVAYEVAESATLFPEPITDPFARVGVGMLAGGATVGIYAAQGFLAGAELGSPSMSAGVPGGFVEVVFIAAGTAVGATIGLCLAPVAGAEAAKTPDARELKEAREALLRAVAAEEFSRRLHERVVRRISAGTDCRGVSLGRATPDRETEASDRWRPAHDHVLTVLVHELDCGSSSSALEADRPYAVRVSARARLCAVGSSSPIYERQLSYVVPGERHRFTEWSEHAPAYFDAAFDAFAERFVDEMFLLYAPLLRTPDGEEGG